MAKRSTDVAKELAAMREQLDALTKASGAHTTDLPLLRDVMYDLMIDRIPVKAVDVRHATANDNDAHTFCKGVARRFSGCVLERVNKGQMGEVEFRIAPQGNIERDPSKIHDRMSWSPEHKCDCEKGGLCTSE